MTESHVSSREVVVIIAALLLAYIAYTIGYNAGQDTGANRAVKNRMGLYVDSLMLTDCMDSTDYSPPDTGAYGSPTSYGYASYSTDLYACLDREMQARYFDDTAQ